ncbi:MAG TPA: protein kinase [Candidatus Methylomirabilis sp.]|jgi:tetratricopeptide (TPR) repeat protein
MLQPGDTLNHGAYRIERQLGAGGFGVVYLATEVALERPVAIKTILPEMAAREPEVAEAFYTEARLTARLSHPHIIPIYFVGEEVGRGLPLRYVVMEYLAGGDLEKALARETWDLPQRLRWMGQLAEGLGYAHGQGILHRDLKLRNVFLTPNQTVKIGDFGLAKAMGAQTKTVLKAMGTPAYLSPEQVQGRSGDARADLYALGVMYYQLLTGRLPYDAPDIVDTTAKLMAICYQHVHAPIPSARVANPAVPPEVDGLVQRLMAKAPEARPGSAAEVAHALAPFLAPAPRAPIPLTQPAPAGAEPSIPMTQPSILAPQGAIDDPEASRPRGRRFRLKWLAIPGLLLAAVAGAVVTTSYLDEAGRRRAEETRRVAEERRQAEQRRAEEEAARLRAEEARRKEDEERRWAEEAQRKAAEEQRGREEQARLRAEEARRQAELKRAEEARRKAEEERKQAEEEARQARLQAEEARRQAEAEQKRAEEARRKAEEERQARLQEEAARRRAVESFNRGSEKLRKNDYRGALEDFAESLRSDPKYATAWSGRGYARLRLGEYSASVADLSEALRLSPDLVAAYMHRGEARAGLGDISGALQDYQKAADLFSAQGNTRGREAALARISRLQEPAKPVAPSLLSPRHGETVPQPYIRPWAFSWSPPSPAGGVSKYRVFVKAKAAQKALVDAETTETRYLLSREGCGYIAEGSRFDWTWKVQAQNRDGTWGPWSAEYTFSVAPFDRNSLCQKCPSSPSCRR